jgi:hypothetical protein
MSEKKEARTLEQIQQEYQNMCLRAGHKQYQIFALQKELDVLNEEIRNLNFEAASLQAKASEEQPKPAQAESESK